MTSINIPIQTLEPATGMAEALMEELATYLARLADTDQGHIIDLSSLPLNKSDLIALTNRLGQGEAYIKLTTIGDTEIFETNYSGIWWIKHFAPDGQLLSEQLEICYIPEIVKAQKYDIKAAAKELSVKSEIEEDEYKLSSA